MEKIEYELLANKLKTLRAKSGLSQIDLSKKSGVGVCTISFIEKAVKKEYRFDTLVKLAKALNVDESELLRYVY